LRAMKDERVDTHTINLADGFMISYKKWSKYSII
jgi:hypothetical protein